MKSRTDGKNISLSNLIWIMIWVTVFVAFILLDLYFRIFHNEKDIFETVSLGSHSFEISVLENGNFIGVKILKLCAIILNLIYALKRSHKDRLLIAALAFTLLADTFFTFNPVSARAVFIFCFAQYFHSLRFSKNKRLSLARATVAVLFLIFGYVSKLSNIYAFAYIYTFLIIGNIHLSYRNLEKTVKEKTSEKAYLKASAFAFAGFILFYLCDVNIALTFYCTSGILSEYLGHYLAFIAWFFYYPSQVLIINSSLLHKE